MGKEAWDRMADVIEKGSAAVHSFANALSEPRALATGVLVAGGYAVWRALSKLKLTAGMVGAELASNEDYRQVLAAIGQIDVESDKGEEPGSGNGNGAP